MTRQNRAFRCSLDRRRGERTRTTYADLRFNDFRPATETEVVIAEDGTETELLKRTYTYEDSPQVNRTTVTETALGSDQVHTSVEETYGEAAEYPTPGAGRR